MNTTMKFTSRDRRRRSRLAGAVVLGLALPLTLAACSSDSGGDTGSDAGAETEEATAWEPTKDIDFIVPYSAGGGFDIYSRGIAKVMQETQLPKGTNVVVRNTPPLPQGITTLFTGPSDGYTIGMLPMPAAIAMQLRQPDVAHWKTDEFTVLGSVDENGYVVYVASDSPYKTVDDLIAADELKTFNTEEGSSSALATDALTAATGMKTVSTFGAESSAEIVTAALRGDSDFFVTGTTDVTGFVESGDIRPILFLGTEEQRPESLEWLQDVPGAEEAGFPELAGTVSELRLIVAPKGLPDEVADYLRNAVYKTMTSDEFAEWAVGAERPIVPKDFEDATDAMNLQIKQMNEFLGDAKS